MALQMDRCVAAAAAVAFFVVAYLCPAAYLWLAFLGYPIRYLFLCFHPMSLSIPAYSLCLSVSASVFLSVSLSMSLFVCLSVSLALSFHRCLTVFLFAVDSIFRIVICTLCRHPSSSIGTSKPLCLYHLGRRGW